MWATMQLTAGSNRILPPQTRNLNVPCHRTTKRSLLSSHQNLRKALSVHCTSIAERPQSSNGNAPIAELTQKQNITPSQQTAPDISYDSSRLHAILLVQCPDAKGVVASLAQLLYGFGCNIVESDQFTDTDEATFFQRIKFDYTDIAIGPGNMQVLERAINELASRYSMEWSILYSQRTTRVAILVSKMDHCLYDLLIRHKAGELNCQIPVIISNHPDLEHVAKQFGIDYVTLPAGCSKEEREAHIEAALEEHGINLIILARYMQIFSAGFCDRHWKHTINIHHSFLPAFEGAKPYHRAHERGVKIIGATAHYATKDLDAGPIIEQDITRITHRDCIADMIRKGRDLERLVLARAVRWHLAGRILVHGNKTVVFED